jgi:hypothetical protein
LGAIRAHRGSALSTTVLWNFLKEAGGILAVVTAGLYAAGFLSMQTHLTVLGIAPLVDVSPLTYLLTGALFMYSLPAFLLGGSLLAVPSAVAGWVLWRAFMPARPLIVLSIGAAVAIGAVVLAVAMLIPPTGILYGAPDTLITGYYRRGAEGRVFLLVLYGIYAMHVALLAVASGLWLRARKQLSKRLRLTVLEVGTGTTIGLLVLLVPVVFGACAVPLSFPRVLVMPAKDARFGPVDGWMLNRSLTLDSSLVVYVGDAHGGRVIVIKKDLYESLDVSKPSYLVLPDSPRGTSK